MNKPKFETPDMVEKNIEKLAELFPNCVTTTNFKHRVPPRGCAGAVRVHLGGETCGYC